ncbi:TIGR00341 family protein [Sphingomonas sp. CGMCC 1.13654]|uniref:TIGR00341 family protein n=1 Tax=Sphingomonas chungangi TaxID=2683589 RepID=A0A838L3U0_9SPHN|nr:TIGR00341 family protein [Sphingomonas chungangi]MBA2932876.1 TIGR00341 family protein [Sphingomonas chungangi]MVW56496.1 TIGR00341 family protein [Sphingomonas chungangi]
MRETDATPAQDGDLRLTDRLPAPLRVTARWWRINGSGSVDHAAVIERVCEESGWSPRFAFMTIMSAGIAVLGLLLSSPAVVIGAMLISPLMGPIMGLGFSLALFDFKEMRRSVTALVVSAALAVMFTGLVVLCSPLKAATAEILARTRPNLFDLLVALFSALAGAFALIRGRGETIVGVAIATALMPPLATVGYGLATANLSIAGGAFALFGTNFVTIALSATIMARLYGFGHRLSSQQSWLQTALLLTVFVLMAIPLAISLDRIAREAVIATQVRGVLASSFAREARVTQLDIDYEADPIAVRAVIIVPKSKALRTVVLAERLQAKLKQPVTLRADQVLVDPASAALDQEKAAFAQAQEQQRIREEGTEISHLLAVAAGVDPGTITIDRDARRAIAAAHPLPGASLAAYQALEARVGAQAPGWTIFVVPPSGLALSDIGFAQNVDALDDGAQAALRIDTWAAQRWNWPALAVPGLTEPHPERPNLGQRRAAAVAGALRRLGLTVVAAKVSGNNATMRLQQGMPE